MVTRSRPLKAFIVAGIVAWTAAGVAGFLLAQNQQTQEMFAYSQIIPILVAAFFFGRLGGLAAALAASLASGSAVIGNMADIDSPFIQRLMFQIIYFNSVALATSFLSDRAKKAQADLQRQVERLTALRAIDRSITGGLGLKDTLGLLLEWLVRLLEVDAAAIFLLDAGSQKLVLEAGYGLPNDLLAPISLKLGQGYAGAAAQQQRTIHIPDLNQAPVVPVERLRDSGFMAYLGVPLLVKEQLIGVLEVYHRTPIDPDGNWIDYLETLAGQAAIAIQDAQLMLSLQSTNTELTLAYEETLRGWSRALDLRDRETEGHSQRVAEMAVRLAQAMGLSGEALTHIHRGALLHDIGKVGISDNILLKPGALTDEEWKKMRQHPEFAYQLLAPIRYLNPALTIPYMHHERWDGSGYPIGLKGDKIPLEARIFAVIDVWDALGSDRPYRAAWSEAQVREYLQSQAGKTFDPQVVAAFLALLDGGDASVAKSAPSA